MVFGIETSVSTLRWKWSFQTEAPA